MVWAIIGLTAAYFAVMGLLCMRVRVGGKAFNALRRSVKALGMLLCFSCLPGVSVGINLLNVATVACLGLPGAVLLQVIAWMP
ncbi:MAG: hypothetical protein IKM26_02415 [Clostridia bacterium]|nr:hypothetical protein [Clostridia bacterium]